MTPIEKAQAGLPLSAKEIAGFREAFSRYPARFTQEVTNEGRGFLGFAVHQPLDCGCAVIGNGSIPFPLTVKPCSIHQP